MTLRSDWEFRGIVHQVTDPVVFDQLAAGGVSGYIGFDPTASSLHVGSLLQLMNLRRLQVSGNRPILVAGGGTGLIGDPSHKATERPLLTVDQIRDNVEGIRRQLERFVDFSPGANQAVLVDNADWLTKLSLTDFLRDTGKHFTVNQMIAKDSVKSRLDRDNVGISYTEFSYMLLQAYDFLHLYQTHGCTLQLGGSDQWGNITAGAELIRKVTGATAYGITSPLLTKSDGTKFGKSEGGNVWLDASLTSPFAMHQFFLQTDDELVVSLLKSFTFLSHEDIGELATQVAERPQDREAQRRLAHEVVTTVHGAEAAEGAERAGRALFSESIRELDESTLREVTAEAPTSVLERSAFLEGIDIAALMVRTTLAGSNGEARRFLEQGGVYVNNVRATAGELVSSEHLLHDRYVLLRRGKRTTHLVIAQ